MIDAEEYRRLALEFAKAMVVQVSTEALSTIPNGWGRFCNDVFDLTDAFVDGLQDRLARYQAPADDGAHVEVRTGQGQR